MMFIVSVTMPFLLKIFAHIGCLLLMIKGQSKTDACQNMCRPLHKKKHKLCTYYSSSIEIRNGSLIIDLTIWRKSYLSCDVFLVLYVSKLAKTLLKLIQIPGNTDFIFLGALFIYSNSRSTLYSPMFH